MNKKTVTIKNIDTELLSQQKNDLIDVLRFLEESSENYPDFHTENWISSLDGLLNMIDDIEDIGW
jgi:hypothetical protein